MPIPLVAAGLMAGAKIGGDIIGGISANKASLRAQAAQQKALREASGISQDYYGKAIEGHTPFQQAGTEAFQNLASLTGEGAFNVDAPVFDPGDPFSSQSVLDDPGYQFRLGQGTGAVEQSAAARGGALGGQTLKDLTSFSQGLASDEIGNAYNRFANERGFRYGTEQDLFRNRMNQQQQRFGRLSDIAGFGERAAGQVGRLQTGLGDILSGNRLTAGNVSAQGTMGRAKNFRNTLSSSIGGLSDLAGGFGGLMGGGGGGGGLGGLMGKLGGLFGGGGGGGLPQGGIPGLDFGSA